MRESSNRVYCTSIQGIVNSFSLICQDFSTVSSELKAWTIPAGTPAPKAAGKIHSDMGKGLIRAEVISYNNLESCSNLAEARKRDLLRTEGKNYIIQDGDVVTFLFNV